ncbi:GntR family transcriptional regulator [Prauserella sp. PE36]|uniref:GntR family transcriptional regulator n=1 Tax=Prauserella endophytica TaxID=1592324 RepID=A0ABY2S995_9PSEU|nr:MULTISPECIES: GntR family transcriptional regulator [Prauserella]PXY30419.1 phosphonate metabolism protein PhnF [Prauserella coralliicola]RBM21157.1 GntR family transcriptional regulator [Prauserella sp. PE36]TKG72246.1 GntR family transcriptional regulator [Prauserella endophytica]
MSSTRYLEIAERLAAELAGRPAGTRVASEPELAQRFGVGRAAARSALQELERRLLVRRVQGAGTFVNRRIDYVISHSRPPSWSATVQAAGAVPRSVIKDVDRLPLPAGPAAQLRREPGTLAHRVAREFYIDDLLATWIQEWIPVDVVPELELALQAADSLDLVLRQMGRVKPVRAWCRASLDVPPPEVVRNLRIEASAPTWQVESLSCDAETGAGLTCSTAWTRADAVRMVVELQETLHPDQPEEEQR